MFRLLRILIVTDRRLAYSPLPIQIARVLDGILHVSSIPAGVLFREKDLDIESRSRLAKSIAQITRAAGVPLFVSTGGTKDGGAEIARHIGADGLHLSSDAAVPSRAPSIVGRSCHVPMDLSRAALEGMTYVTLSPVFDSVSKPGLGGRGADLIKRAVLADYPRPLPPIFALGGVVPRRVPECIRAGAYGVAVCGAFMGPPNPGAYAQEIAAELDRVLGGEPN
jgi:thiamine-phosphate pyrophosphorylase